MLQVKHWPVPNKPGGVAEILLSHRAETSGDAVYDVNERIQRRIEVCCQ
jgi:hypothetical protein